MSNKIKDTAPAVSQTQSWNEYLLEAEEDDASDFSLSKPPPKKVPYLYRILSSTTFELDDLSDEILKREKEKQRAFELACKVQAGLVQVRHEMEMGDTPNSGEALQEFEKHVIEMSNLDSAGNKRERDGTSSGVVEDFVRAKVSAGHQR